MSVSLIATIQCWQGLSSDVKPLENINEGSTFAELDSGRRYVYRNKTGWIEDMSAPVSTAKAIDIGNSQRNLLELISIETKTTRELMEELVAIKRGE